MTRTPSREEMELGRRLKRLRNRHLYCLGCENHVGRLFESGRNPKYYNYCAHKSYTIDNSWNLDRPEDGRLIGWSDIKPDWCPLRIEPERDESL
jgi:hypothetical protein